jgi:5-deoxy-glucuronate isomerase
MTTPRSRQRRPGPVVSLHRRWSAGAEFVLGPEDAGWTWTGLRVVTIAPGETRTVETGANELYVLPLAGSVRVSIGVAGKDTIEATYDLEGRDTVFTRVTDFAYVGRDSVVRLVAGEHHATVAMPSSRCETRLPSAYGPAEGVAVETRGSGSATRQVNGFGIPDVWDHAEKLIACELITPPGNWSSYPPHKHDASDPCEVANEEIYYYRVAGRDQVTPDPEAFGYHRTYTGLEHDAAGMEPIDLVTEIRDGDVVLVPHGYHGPSVAAPDYPLYYLNVLAGPGPERSMAFYDDPTHAWIRDAWPGQATDPRVPVTSSHGRVVREGVTP